ncbi:MAG: hypothetical protein ACTS3F_13630 [Phycisphaerales bacterium]
MANEWQSGHDGSDSGMRAGPAAPPTQAGQVRAGAGTTRWATVFGVISIVLSSLGLLGGLCSAIAIPFSASMSAAASQQGGPNPFSFGGPMALQVVAQLIGLGLSVMLLVAGIQLLKRRASGVSLHKLWAMVSIPIVLIMMGVNAFFMSQQMNAAMASQGNTPPPGVTGTMVVFSVAFGLVGSLTYPVIVLWWMNRARVKEESSGWA